MELRGYQKESISALWDWFRKNPQGAPLLVLPTGAGKSLVIADVARRVAEKGKRVLVLAHRKELLEQNYAKLAALMPWGNLGMYSAGLNRKDAAAQVVVGGIQSVYQRTGELGKFALVLVDECHLVPPDGEGMYQTLIAGLCASNPDVRFAGLSATPYRLGSGMLTQSGGLFTAVAHEVGIKDLIKQGYLAPLVTKAGQTHANLASVGTRAGEFIQSDMERAFNRLDLVEAALAEDVAYGADRKSWLIFASGVAHAEQIGKVLNRVGIKAGVVTGNTLPLFREQILRDFKAGLLQALVNCDVLTTGFDHPDIDLIAVHRATQSVGLWVQICGRGCRTAPEKENCLVLDHGENAECLGPIDQIRINKRYNPLAGREESSVETPPTKVCLACQSVVVLSTRECPDCGAAFPEPMRIKHKAEASTAPIISEPEKPIEVEVHRVEYARHEKRDSQVPTLRVDYALTMLGELTINKVSEWVCLEHEGFALRKAMAWWRGRSEDPTQDYPESVGEALARQEELRKPRKLAIQRDGKFWRVISVLEWYKVKEVGDIALEEAELAEKMGLNI